MVMDHLSLVKKNISEGTARVERQRQLVEKLGRDGHDTGPAIKLLSEFEELLEIQIKIRDRIEAELAVADQALTIAFELPPSRDR